MRRGGAHPRRLSFARARVFGLAGLALLSSSASAQVSAHRSATTLVSTNGRSAVVYSVPDQRVQGFLEHIYRSQSSGQQTRDFAYDSYAGLRVGADAQWLTDVTPSLVEYETGTGIIHIRRELLDVSVDQYVFAPMDLAEHAYIDLVRVTRGGATAAAVDGFFLYNFHLGVGSPEPSASGETLAWHSESGSFLEWGDSGAALGYAGVTPPSHHGASPEDPFARLLAGSDLGDNAGSGGAMDDAVAGLQWSLGSLSPGQSAWFGGFVVLDAAGDVLPRVREVQRFISSRTPEQVLQAERGAWTTWHAAGVAPAGSALEQGLLKQSLAVLRMGQVAEAGRGNGQILASLPTGMWNIAWVRDMAYAVAALIRSGHLAEAKRALEFQLNADSGHYAAEVGRAYQISITRYFGDGVEETDFNEFGPNIEFDGFGLFLWTLHEYARAGGDMSLIEQRWPQVSRDVADVLLSLQEPSGLIAADSSIWEVHWDGQQKHFAYTTLTAANGLCRAALLADALGDAARAQTYRAAGRAAQRALLTQLSAADGSIAQSLEELESNSGFLDAAAIEAVGLGLVDPRGRAANATLAAMRSALVPASRRGFFRNDDGGWYDNQEWVFVDLRTAHALRKMRDTGAAELLSWVTAQGADNFNQIAELHDEKNADYRGEVPMVGFGAGAYILALRDREAPDDLIPCGVYADAAGAAGSSGAGGAGAGGAGAVAGAAGGSSAASEAESGCGCKLSAQPTRQGPSRRQPFNLYALFGLSALGLLQRRAAAPRGAS